jgi:hypothetical protein
MWKYGLAACGAWAGAAAALGQVKQIDAVGRDGRTVISRIPHSGPGLLPRRTITPGGVDSGWQLMSVPAGVYVRAISMGTAFVGFAAAEQGVVLRSVDSGASWQTILNMGFPYYWYGVHAFDSQTLVITGFNNSANTGIMRWSTDGGTTWGPVLTLATTAVSPIPWLYFVNYAAGDANHGVIQMAIGTEHTSNGGLATTDWTFNEPTNNWFLGPSTFLSDLRVWMTGYDNFRSPDGGATWTPLPRADPTFDGPSGFVASGHGFIGGGSISPTVAGWMYSSENGGNWWSTQRVLQPAYPIRAILVQDGQRAWAVGGNYYSNVGGIWGTTDGGVTWTLEQNTGSEILDIERVATASGWNVYAAGEVSQIWQLHVAICYPNCDGSTAGPILNANDFQCFLNKFAAGDPWANCDGSTANPVLNANDFQCFLNAFAAGCS